MSIDALTDLRALRATFAGSVILAGDPGWDDARQTFNLTDDQRPALIAIPQDARDVAAAVRFARARNLRIAPQGTGHNAGPLGPLDGTILLKTSAMSAFSIDPVARRARVEAGVRWGPVADAASAHGLAPLAGSSRTVGIIGFSLGGGVGWLGRKHGLQTNAVTAIELVTAEGELIRVDHDHEPELFWALRGGGGNFGVVTAIEFALFPVERVYAGQLMFPFERAREVLHAWHEWCETTPDEVTSVIKLMQFPPLELFPEPLRGNAFAIVQAAFLGDEADGIGVFEPLRALGPVIDTFAMVEPSALGYLAMDPEDPVPYTSGHQMYGDLSREAIDTFVDLAGPGSESPLLMAELRQLGGALARSHDDHGVRDRFPGRYLSFLLGAVMDPEQGAAARAHIERMRAALAMYEVGRYINFVEQPTEARRIFDEPTLARLREVKATWDPRDLFHANHQINR